MDCGFSLQEQAVQAVEAGRTLGVTLTEHHMLQPEKSMAILYELTDDPEGRDAGRVYSLSQGHAYQPMAAAAGIYGQLSLR